MTLLKDVMVIFGLILATGSNFVLVISELSTSLQVYGAVSTVYSVILLILIFSTIEQ